MSSKDFIEGSCKTYNKCVSSMIRRFKLKGVFRAGRPSVSFEDALDSIEDIIKSSKRTTRSVTRRDFSDLRMSELRNALTVKAESLLNKSRARGKPIKITRVNFIKRVGRHLSEKYRMKEIKRWHPDAQSGPYKELNKRLRILFRNYLGLISAQDGHLPGSFLRFDGTKWDPSERL